LKATPAVPAERLAGADRRGERKGEPDEQFASHESARFAPGVKILSVVGNRPQFIKSAPLSLALRNRADEVTLHTGQHYDRELSEIFFEELELQPPAYRLDAGSGSHADQTARMLPGIERVVLDERPDTVLVYGDTNSTLAGALAAAKAGFPVTHVEAGLRSFDRTMPEELNRIVVDRLSDLLFCPTETAVANLRREGTVDGIHVVGDVMLDAILRLAPIARERSQALADASVSPGEYVLATIHRPVNVQAEGLTKIVAGLGRLGEPVVLPAHPRTRAALSAHGIELPPNIVLRPPAGYLDFAALASQARVVVTDSGGVQKEAYWYGVPCVTVRTTTEWVETVEEGWNRLVAADPDAIVEGVSEAQPNPNHPPLYGDGHAADLIADVLCTIDRR
jgi:UDP-N-acetylglucosamine 2-epimerase